MAKMHRLFKFDCAFALLTPSLKTKAKCKKKSYNVWGTGWGGGRGERGWSEEIEREKGNSIPDLIFFNGYQTDVGWFKFVNSHLKH
jgi:hypothetical protein